MARSGRCPVALVQALQRWISTAKALTELACNGAARVRMSIRTTPHIGRKRVWRADADQRDRAQPPAGAVGRSRGRRVGLAHLSQPVEARPAAPRPDLYTRSARHGSSARTRRRTGRSGGIGGGRAGCGCGRVEGDGGAPRGRITHPLEGVIAATGYRRDWNRSCAESIFSPIGAIPGPGRRRTRLLASLRWIQEVRVGVPCATSLRMLRTWPSWNGREEKFVGLPALHDSKAPAVRQSSDVTTTAAPGSGQCELRLPQGTASGPNIGTSGLSVGTVHLVAKRVPAPST
jgi:hypothetical protein